MKDSRRFDMECFLTRKDMLDLVRNGKSAKCLKRIEKKLSEEDYDKIMTEFDTKVAYEIKPVLQIKTRWLAKIFGFNGELRVNVDTQNFDAIYVGKNGQIVKLELKHFSMAEVRRTKTGEAERTSEYSPDGGRYYKISKKSWKFRSTEFHDDAVILMMVDNRTDILVDAIVVQKDDAKKLILECLPPKYNGGSHPCHVAYRNVREYPHMNGNMASPNSSKMLTEWLTKNNVIIKNGKKYFQISDNKVIADSRIGVMKWFINDFKKTNRSRFFSLRSTFLDETCLRKEMLVV